MTYSGPIIDPHVHFWDRSMNRHPWLRAGNASVAALGDLGVLRRDHLPRDYLADAADQNVVALVHIEAGWEPVDALGESTWLAGLDRPAGMAARCVAFVALEATDVAASLEAHCVAAGPMLAGVRARLSWHPDPAKRFAPREDLMQDPAWRSGVALLAPLGLHLEVMLYPHQADALARLAADMPDLRIVVNHCGSPVDRDREGVLRWWDSLRVLAANPNVAIKISNIGAYIRPLHESDVEDVVGCCVEAFGSDRCMFASDWPVVTLHTPLAQVFAQFRAASRALSADEQAALFRDTAARLYRIATSGEHAASA